MAEVWMAVLVLLIALFIYMDARIECSHSVFMKIGRRHGLPRLESMAWNLKHQTKWTAAHWEKWAQRKYGPRKAKVLT